ncbi:MAG: AAA family ATPase [Hydrogenophaga sp.]|uniref:AAA family ATPase n=1 Tax=Hydrogenophaga sp. TaxID=1904254 RepID=UPI0025BFF899|nr:AAA family ATPase [Hydrogenophaga sp.]MCG2655771.1 AAA family ATPase [Hydrogenophaga sp.]
METVRPESVIPSRAQALFPEAEFKLRHPLFQAMPYPLGADPRLLELEKFVLKSLDPDISETLRHASIRYVGRWLHDNSFDVGRETLLTDFFLLHERTPWSVDKMHAFATAYLTANGIRIERRREAGSEQRAFKLVQGQRTLPIGETLGDPFAWCMKRFSDFVEVYPWTEGVTLGTSACFKAADLLFMYVQHGLHPNGEWSLIQRRRFMQTEGYAVWTALSLALTRTDRAAQLPSRRESLERGMHDVVLGQIEDSFTPAPAAPKRGELVRDPDGSALCFKTAADNSGSKAPVLAVVRGQVPPAGDPGDRQTLERFKPLESPLPVALMPSVAQLEESRSRLVREFPWARIAIHIIFSELITRRSFGSLVFHMRPVLLLGPPGIGKTRFARRFAEEMALGFRAISLAGMSDVRSLTGTARGWSTGQPSVLLEPLLNSKSASSLVLLDEIEKAVDGGSKTPAAADFLLGLLEPENARNWFDSFLQTECDLSRLVFIATANSLAGLSTPLLSRVTVLDFGRPTPEDIRGVIPFALQDIAKDWELPKNVFDAVVPPVDVDVPNMRDLKVWLTWYLAQWAEEHLPAERQHR